MATALDLVPQPAPEPHSARSAAGVAALEAVRRGLLTRAAERGRVRLETIPATWPMTRHLVRRMGEQLVREGLLEAAPHGSVRITLAGLRALESRPPR